MISVLLVVTESRVLQCRAVDITLAALYALDMRIGIDIGNVIIGGGGEDTFFTEKFLDTPAMEDAWESVRGLWEAQHELHIISKCGKETERKSLIWLDVYGISGLIPVHRTHFVRKRELKAPMAQALELGIFIDDREDIIDSMQGIVKHPILFTSWEQTNAELERIFSGEA